MKREDKKLGRFGIYVKLSVLVSAWLPSRRGCLMESARKRKRYGDLRFLRVVVLKWSVATHFDLPKKRRSIAEKGRVIENPLAPDSETDFDVYLTGVRFT